MQVIEERIKIGHKGKRHQYVARTGCMCCWWSEINAAAEDLHSGDSSSQTRSQGSIPHGGKVEQTHFKGFFQSCCSSDFIIAFLNFIQCLQIKSLV